MTFAEDPQKVELFLEGASLLQLRNGVRALYGGADNDDTFNLATFGYLTAGLSVRL